jgi:O-antigen/teichoic acid export membrane protein
VGKIKLQLTISIFAAVINVPLAILLGKNFGIEGVLMSNIMVLIVSSIIYPIQYQKLITNKATGVWAK